MRKNIFVIGDLYIDHDIFVTELEPLRDSGGLEARYNVIRRQDTAGGAANTARILSVLNDGRTFLWGVVGTSHWGNFRTVLEKSEAIDGANRPIELRGVGDETDPPMNTVTRLLVVEDNRPDVVIRRAARYYDIDHVHISEEKRDAVIYHLEHIEERKIRFDAIVINDFERNTITKPLIDRIATFAVRHRIPLFVDPHYTRSRYIGIKATAILPNLREWCELVGDVRPEYWRNNLSHPEALREMAVLSFQHLGNFEYHIIKCDRDGAVLFLPHAGKRELYAIYHLPPVALEVDTPRAQMGCGDIMTAVFALEFPAQRSSSHAVLQAFHRANEAVAAYREMTWHRMPSGGAVQAKRRESRSLAIDPDADITKGVLFLPKARTINLRVCETSLEGLYSQDETFKATIRNLLNDVTSRWAPERRRSIVLGAPPGTGKTTILNCLPAIAAHNSIETENMTATRNSADGLHTISPTTFRDEFRRLRDGAGGRLLIFVDEALKEPTLTFIKQHAPVLLEAAHAEEVRFLFMSSEFTLELEEASEWRELFGRCRTYYLSDLEERPFDIPYIVAARCFENRPSLHRLIMDGRFLLAATVVALRTPEPRVVCEVVDETFASRKGESENTELRIGLEELPARFACHVNLPKGDFGTYEFIR